MKIQVVQAVVFSTVSLWACTSHAQQQQLEPRIAVKLGPEAQQKQQADPSFIASLFQRAEPQGFAAAPKVTVNPLIGAERSANISARLARAAKRDASIQAPSFDAWYQVQVGSRPGEQVRRATEPKDGLPQDIVELVHALHKLPDVESVHALYAAPPPAIDPSDDPRSSNQGYLNPAPEGIDARYGWGFPGGDGAGVNIVDMEQGWKLDHEDLAAQGITFISGRNYLYFTHGTGVLGELFMVDNQIGGVGIVPGARGRVISQIRDNWYYNTPETILDAAAHMSAGDILLLEAQEWDPRTGTIFMPVEVADATFEAIKVATSLGIIVVEAGANAAVDLDAYTDLSGKRIFDRSSPDYRESGAIMVGASSYTLPRYRWYGTNYGSRIDVHAWGEGIDTTDTDEKAAEHWYTSWFGGTSGASPIVVGAAAIIQGISQATRGVKLSPLEMRDVLKINGTPSNDPAFDRISVMPNLRAIIDTLFDNNNNTNQTTDIYIRDHVGDAGDTTSGTISASPDIIVRQQPIANPDLALGPGSGTESNPSLSQPVLAGHDHSVYIRLLNRGTAAAAAGSTTVSVYWSEPATLVTPNMWQQIGTVTFPSIIPSGNVTTSSSNSTLTVSPRLDWPASAAPDTAGHYCFVALAGTRNDPVPVVPTTFPDFAKFVRENNNVAWQNFNVVSAPANAKDRWHRFAVAVPGAWDGDREFTLRAVGKLPQGSKVRLQLPKDLSKALRVKGGCAEKEAVTIGLHPGKTVTVGKGTLGKGSLARCELQVRVPEEVYGTEGEVEFALVQEWEGVEMGRVTWRFGPEAEL
ncbi:peptidase S8/S53 domain-containing protein [Chaetomium strumarium]|uniref:Peptidase S8/S53 domain-containing protein n=1 Tax=Chaetomium strumarium TaxID=1170767 RepID=A0AAJ0M507_9PEZI|nr:peptidase S8/S53 domain-containing protein [Chaetomium strumarium]